MIDQIDPFALTQPSQNPEKPERRIGERLHGLIAQHDIIKSRMDLVHRIPILTVGAYVMLLR